ncbi:multicopper oxidase domain-containing protein [Paenibacillus lautus]
MMRKRLKLIFSILLVLIALGGGSFYLLAKASVHPASMDMGSMGHEMAGMEHLDDHPGGISVTTLKEAPSDAPAKTFELTAEEAELDIGDGKKISAWTFNGTAPGPEIRVQEGDRLIVHVKNKLTDGIAIHWHGVELPNAEDGVAGVTQDAIPTDGKHTYNFIAVIRGPIGTTPINEVKYRPARGCLVLLLLNRNSSPLHMTERSSPFCTNGMTIPLPSMEQAPVSTTKPNRVS